MYNLSEHLISIGLCQNNIWLDKYCELIESNRDTKKVKYKTQLHHIIPRYFFKEKCEAVDNSNDNCVFLSHKDHALAHYYLALCSANDTFKAANALAIRHVLTNSTYKLQDVWSDERLFIESLSEYQNLMEESSRYVGSIHRGKIESIDTRLKKSKSHTGLKYKEMSTEGRKNISKAKRGRTHVVYDNTRKKISNTRRELKLVNIRNDLEKKSVPESELEYWLSQGFEKGWGAQWEPGTRCWVNNGEVSKNIPKSNINDYISKGWTIGRLNFLSDETKMKISENVRKRNWPNIIWVNNGLINKRVDKDSVPAGFNPGRLKK